MLLPTLLDGLIWRSHRADSNGMRRVNYYIKHLLIDNDGNFSDALRWLTANGDPGIISSPVVVLVSDSLWRLATCPRGWSVSVSVGLSVCLHVAWTLLGKMRQRGAADRTVKASLFIMHTHVSHSTAHLSLTDNSGQETKLPAAEHALQ